MTATKERFAQMFMGGPRNPVKRAQKLLGATSTADPGDLVDAIDKILQGQLWNTRTDRNGNAYSSFGEFAVDQRPRGLGVRSASAFATVRWALLQREHYGPLTSLLAKVTRQRGRPPKNLAQGENFFPFHRVPTSMTSIDRMLLTLERDHPQFLAQVCDGRLTPKQAAVEAGLIKAVTQRLFGACDIDAVANLNEKAQIALIREFFPRLKLNAQCTFLSQVIEPRTHTKIAEAWRASSPK